MSLPKDENKFAIYLYDVPMDKEKVLAAEQGELGSICNYADVKYTGSKDKNTVPSCQKQFENIKSNISKTGKLSKISSRIKLSIGRLLSITVNTWAQMNEKFW